MPGGERTAPRCRCYKSWQSDHKAKNLVLDITAHIVYTSAPLSSEADVSDSTPITPQNTHYGPPPPNTADVLLTNGWARLHGH